MNSIVILALYAFAYAVLFAVWVAFVFCHTTGAETIISYIQAALVALTSHVFTLIVPPQSGNSKDVQ